MWSSEASSFIVFLLASVAAVPHRQHAAAPSEKRLQKAHPEPRHDHNFLYVSGHKTTEFCCAQLPPDTSAGAPKRNVSRLRYVQVFKSDTQGICTQLRSGASTRDCEHSDGAETFTFSFVREPLEARAAAASNPDTAARPCRRSGPRPERGWPRVARSTSSPATARSYCGRSTPSRRERTRSAPSAAATPSCSLTSPRWSARGDSSTTSSTARRV